MKSSFRGLESKIKLLLFVRMLVIVVALCSVVLVGLAHVGEQDASWFKWAPYLVLVVACVANLVYLLAYRLESLRKPLAAIQVVLDPVLVAALVYVTGGGYSPFTVLFFLCVLGAGIIGGTSWGLASAGGASIFMFVVTLLYGASAAGLIGDLPLLGRETLQSLPRNIYESLGYVLLESGAFFLVGLLSGNLSQRLYGSVRLTDAILDNMSEGLFVVGNSGELVYMNKPALDILGIRETDPVGHNVYNLLGRHGLDSLATMVGAGCEVSEQIELMRSDGRRLPVYVTARPLPGLHGDEGMLVMLADLTERLRMEEVEKKMAHLESLGQMAASIAHEIRNPLSSIRGSAQKLVGLQLDDHQRKLLELIVNSSDRLEQIVSEFLVFARPRRISPREISVKDLLGEVALMIAQKCADGGPSVDVDVPAGLTVSGDPGQLLQVFLNLGINACDAMGDGGKLTIRASSESHSGEPAVRVDFIDTGGGIHPEDMDNLFKPFYTTKPKGTGLGLAIVEKIVQAHGGRLEVSSEAGRGTTVSVWIPNAVPPVKDRE